MIALAFERRAAGERGWAAALGLLLALGVADLVVVGRGINRLAPPELLVHRPAVVSELESGSRVEATSEEGCQVPAEAPTAWYRRWVSVFAFQETLRPPAPARWGLFGSFDGDFTGLGSSWTSLFTWASWKLGSTPLGMRLRAIADVRYVLHVGRSDQGASEVEELPSGWFCPLRVLRVPDPLPRVYLASAEREAQGPEATLSTLLADDFDPRHEVVVEHAAGPVDGPGLAGEARIVARTVNVVVVDARLKAPGTLVLVEAFAPGWRAEVDGSVAPLLRANGLFRAVRLSPGLHRIRFWYRPWSVVVGAAASVVGWIAALGLALGAGWRASPARGQKR